MMEHNTCETCAKNGGGENTMFLISDESPHWCCINCGRMLEVKVYKLDKNSLDDEEEGYEMR